MQLAYEFRSYGRDAAGPEKIEILLLKGDASARSKAGSIAKQIDGPVDLARAGNEPWDERYLTTAAPSDIHASGYRFERLT